MNLSTHDISIAFPNISGPTSFAYQGNKLFISTSNALSSNRAIQVDLADNTVEYKVLAEDLLNPHALAVYQNKVLIGERNANRISSIAIRVDNPETKAFVPGLGSISKIVTYEGVLYCSESNSISTFDPAIGFPEVFLRGPQLIIGMAIYGDTLFYNDVRGLGKYRRNRS